MKPSRLDKRKAALRKQLRQNLLGISQSQRRRKSGKIVDKLTRLSLFRRASRILTYVSLPFEVETGRLIRIALRQKKSVFVPRIDPKSGVLEAYRIKNIVTDLRKGAFNILEPKKSKNKKALPNHLDLLIIPGVGFDRQGGRLGRGAGYFDRFLTKKSCVKKIGLAFREQIVKKVPMGKKDVPVDVVITD